MPRKSVVLVTGISGFVGSHVAVELVRNGYAVKGTVRSTQLRPLQSIICAKYPDIALVRLDDVATGSIMKALQGVDAIIHVASPLAGQGSPQAILDTAVEGTLNILRQAVNANVNKVVLTSSWATTLNPSLKQIHQGGISTSSDWGKATQEEVMNPATNYFAVKILAEQAAWKFAQDHPQLDLATINPPFIYGPIAPGFPLPYTIDRLSTNKFIHDLLLGGDGDKLPAEVSPFFCDVRDVAKAHVAALKVGRVEDGKLKRYLISGGAFSWKDAVEYIAKEFPWLKSRLPSTENPPSQPGPLCTIDTAPAKKDLGMIEYITWKQMVRESVKLLLEVEGTWKLKNHEDGEISHL